MCKNQTKNILFTYNCIRCNEFVKMKFGCYLDGFDNAIHPNLIKWKYCPTCFCEIYQIILDFNKNDKDGVYTKARWLLTNSNEDLKKLKDLYEGKSHKEKEKIA